MPGILWQEQVGRLSGCCSKFSTIDLISLWRTETSVEVEVEVEVEAEDEAGVEVEVEEDAEVEVEEDAEVVVEDEAVVEAEADAEDDAGAEDEADAEDDAGAGADDCVWSDVDADADADAGTDAWSNTGWTPSFNVCRSWINCWDHSSVSMSSDIFKISAVISFFSSLINFLSSSNKTE